MPVGRRRTGNQGFRPQPPMLPARDEKRCGAGVRRVSSRVSDRQWWNWYHQRRRGRLAIAGLAILLAAGLIALSLAALPFARAKLSGNAGKTPAPAAQAHGHQKETVVSLTFDDAYEDQWRYAVPLLRSQHMNATFYVITA